MTTIGIACGQLQSILKFRSSLFKGLWGSGQRPEKNSWRGAGQQPREKLNP